MGRRRSVFKVWGLLGSFWLAQSLVSRGAVSAAAKGPDLSTPENAVKSMLVSLKADDTAQFRACFAPETPEDAELLSPVLARMISSHHLLQAAAAKFGHAEASRIDDWSMGDDADIDRWLAGESLRPHNYPATVGTVTLATGARQWPVTRLGDQWKITLNYLNKELAQEAGAHARRLDKVAPRVRSGELADVEETRTALGLLAIQEATDFAAPADRWARRAAVPGITPLQQAVFQQIGVLAQSQLQQMSNPGSYDLEYPVRGTPDAAGRLATMGMDIVPLLAEALDDTTPTKTMHDAFRTNSGIVPVNEVAARLIVRICDRTFAVGAGRETLDLRSSFLVEKAPEFQKAIAAWYADNRHRTLLQRKIADVEDAYFSNRLEALRWVQAHPAPGAVAPIKRNMVRLLEEMKTREDSLRQAELSLSIHALAAAGSPADEPAAREASQHLLQHYMGNGSNDLQMLSDALHGWASLGGRQEAIRGLEALLLSRGTSISSTQLPQLKLILEGLQVRPPR